MGDLPGITARLHYLVDLGIDAVWLSPFCRSPMVGFGYDVADHCDVDPVFGVLEDADVLLAAAHARGLRVVVDFVPNHSSDRHRGLILPVRRPAARSQGQRLHPIDAARTSPSAPAAVTEHIPGGCERGGM